MEDDRKIWAAICQRDAQAFGSLHRACAPRIEAFLQQIVRNRPAAEDLTQEVFLQLWSRPLTYDPDRGTLRTWLFAVGRNLASEWWRRQKPCETLDEYPTLGSTENKSLLGDAFHKLSEEQRALLWLREVEGHSYIELAATLDIPIGTVRSRLSAARASLRQIWNSVPAHHGRRSA